jgi:hypothetical protein
VLILSYTNVLGELASVSPEPTVQTEVVLYTPIQVTPALASFDTDSPSWQMHEEEDNMPTVSPLPTESATQPMRPPTYDLMAPENSLPMIGQVADVVSQATEDLEKVLRCNTLPLQPRCARSTSALTKLRKANSTFEHCTVMARDLEAKIAQELSYAMKAASAGVPATRDVDLANLASALVSAREASRQLNMCVQQAIIETSQALGQAKIDRYAARQKALDNAQGMNPGWYMRTFQTSSEP